MVNYANGKIYKIQAENGADEDIYIGSTCKKLCQRMTSHRSCYKKYKNGKFSFTTSFFLFDKYGIENCKIYLIENVTATCKEELTKAEGIHIRRLPCVNKNIPGRTKHEYSKLYEEENKDKRRERKKLYEEKNKDKIRERKKQYYIDNVEYKKEKYQENKDKICEQHKVYREVNKDIIAERRKEYYQANKQIILNKQKNIYVCQCGSELTISGKARHEKSKKHLEYIAKLPIT